MNKSSRALVYQTMDTPKTGLPWLAVVLSLALGSAQAQTTNTFTGPSGGLWSAATNWSLGTLPTTSDPVLINSNTTVNVQANSSAEAITLSGNNARINLQANVPLTASSITYTGTNGNNVPIYMDAGTLNLGGGTGSITTSGGVNSYLHVNGDVTLNLASANLTYLWLKSGGGAPAQLSITNGQTFSAVITYLAGIPASGQSTLNLNGGTLNAGTMIFNVTAGAYTNTFNFNSGTLTADTIRRDFDGTSLAFNWNDGTIRNRTNASLTISRGVNATQDMVLSLAGTGTHTFNVDSGRTITVASTATLADKSGEQGTLVKAGAGELIFSGNNSYTGDTTVLGGTLTLNSGQGLSDTGAVTLSNTAGVTLKVNASETIGSLRGGGTAGGNITLADGQSLTIVQADDQIFGGQITGAGGLVKSGTGKLALTKNNNSFVGGVTIEGGILTSDYGSISSANTIVVNSGGTLGMLRTDTWGGATATSTIPVIINDGGNMTSDNQFNTLRDLTLNGGTVSLNGGLASTLSAFAFGGTVTAGGAVTSTIAVVSGSNNNIRLGRQATNEPTTFDVSDPNGQLLVGAALWDNFGSISGLTKSGNGKMVLSAANAYTGPTAVTAGTLQVGNGGTMGSILVNSALSVSNGATLVFNRSDNYGGALNHTISGAGTVAINGGNLTLNAGGSSGYSTNLGFVINNGATATMGHSDMFGGTGWDATTSPGFTVNAGGTLASSNNFNTLWNLNLNGGTLLANGGANAPAQAFALAGTVTVGGSSASLIKAGTNGNGLNNINISGNGNSTLTFNVADVTGNANADLTVTANLQNSRSTLSNLNKTGSGTMVLAGSNSYTGTTTVTDGSLVISNAAYAATITPNAIRVDYSNPPTVGTNNLLPGPVNASSLASYSVNGNGSTTVTLTNSPNLKAIVTSSAPANQKPVINAGQTFSVAENSAAGTAVGTLTATDADSNPLSGWAIVSGNTGGAFALNSSTGQLTVLGSLNYEGTPSYSLAVTVSDGTATSDPVNITVNVSNVPEYSDIFGSADPSADSNGDGISNLLAYALGATNSNSVVERPTLSVTTSNLTLTALVRTNDPKVAVWGNATTTLTNWPTNLIVGLPSADQTGAVSGITQKQDFTVERGTNARQFLRLKATLNQ